MILFYAMDLDPLHDDEKRYILTEALKASNIPNERLLNYLLQEGGLPLPNWDGMALPRGRTLKQCKEAFDNLRKPPYPAPQPLSFSAQPPQNVAQKRNLESTMLDQPYMPGAKRRLSGVESTTSTRDILPKPPNGGSPISMTSAPAIPPKRRGRPPKTEVERRNRDAMQRGELFPAHSGQATAEEFVTSPYAPIAPTPQALPTALPLAPSNYQTPMEQIMPEVQAEDSSGKKKRQRASAKPGKPTPTKHTGESSFSVNPQTPMVREPPVRAQPGAQPGIQPVGPPPAIATVGETLQPAPAPQPVDSATVTTSTLPGTSETVTSAESQPPAEAAS